MAEEDEIDVLGDFSLESFFSRNGADIDSNLGAHSYDESNCDCGSQWFGNQSTIEHAGWCKKVKMYTDFTQPDQDINLVGREVSDETGWTRNEKNMLDRGIEIFGRSSSRLAQFIGTKTASEIKHYLTHYYKHTNVKVEIISHSNVVSNIKDSAFLEENDIPACIEEVVVQLSTASPTVSCRQRSSSDSSNTEMHHHSVPGRTAFFKGGFVNSPTVKPRKRKKVTSLDAKHARFRGGLPKKQTQKSSLDLTAKPRDFNFIDGGKTVVTSVNGEEVVRIEKVISDDDDVDIENSDSDAEETAKSIKLVEPTSSKDIIQTPVANVEAKVETPQYEPTIKSESKEEIHIDLSTLEDHVVKQLCDDKPPKCEIVLDENRVTDLEKCIHFEFFDGRPTKTELRYLKIRNHIVNAWVTSKPNYVTKTSMRMGLKKCGDVNCISRVHQYLERIGAINFGCSQTVYTGSLLELMTHPVVTKEKPKKSEREMSAPTPRLFFGSRPRIKKNFDSDGKGGHTSTHDESGKVINTFVVSEEPVVKQKTAKKIPTNLIYCKPFTPETTADYSVELHLSTVLLMDLHSHMSYTEVMGLIGGQWDPQRKVLTIMRYVPCRSSATSATHCEMCPFSQANAGDIIHNEGLDILGWFHSHPTFAPEPSQQDLETQLLVQKWIGCNKPCVGLILSPFSEALIASPYRCLMVRSEEPERVVPYKFKVKLLADQIRDEQLLQDAKNIFTFECVNTNRINFLEAYFLDATISHLEKFLSSVRMHLAKCSNLSEAARDNIIARLETVCDV